ncbi:MAG TPA: phosphoglucosamine mutase [Candidatus Corynebacterium avicola]|uniref:Phosphoglucosamine mutase n=1 Tax=Candidatus Corynebacterium avicola TaxID=2838527 RepID=A0A9D1RLZ0_9CORY|nr:phosphoglucosamine mutase [Candidatus Corynebacterium avicola]
MSRLFGTDGVRGLANKALTAPMALRLGAAAARVLTETGQSSRRPTAVIGRDPRVSGEMLANALSAGMASQGVDVLNVGVLPTPAVAFLTDDYGADMGVMISASHNPMPDNGIKFFAAGGLKLDDTVEDEIESSMLDLAETGPSGAAIGRIIEESGDALERYLFHLQDAVPRPLDGIRVVVDCANGAASNAAPMAYQAAGAEVVAIHNTPNSFNINDNCGSTHINVVRDAVLEHHADLGLAHDGDADRCLAVDSEGNVIDGDQIMAILAVAMKEAGELRKNTLVATVMSNLGLSLAMKEQGIDLRRTKVGDRYVLADLNTHDLSLGGEQSGHIVIPSHGTTGDGTLTGLSLMARMAETGETLRELASVMTVLPQTLINVPVEDKERIHTSQAVKDAIAEAEAELGDTGRVLLRPSGTEQVYRVMVEAVTSAEAKRVAGKLSGVVIAEG